MDLYDASRSYHGFSRVLAVLGQYYSYGEIISQAPRADVQIYLGHSSEGTFRQTVLAGVTGAIIAAPFTTFIDYTIRSWLPNPDAGQTRVIELLEEQNKLLKEQISAPQRQERIQHEGNIRRHVETHKSELDVIRSITSNSFLDVFRPIGKSVDTVGILAGKERRPVGVVDINTLGLIEADRPDTEITLLQGVVNSFSRSSKTGVMFSAALGRGFRFSYVGSEALPRGDVFSWSQYSGNQIDAEGRFVRFFDGTIKRLEIYRAAKAREE